tara:strand:+ start:187 stop:651 length:465 start_codon:yes stop_codon:yes gene_type:complete
MLKCCECDRDIDIENKIYRCFDGTVCSNKCQIDRCQKIQSKDKKISNFSSWENTTSYLIDPNETTKEIQNSPSFVPIYVKSRSDLKKTISKYNLDNYNEKDISYDYYRNNIDLNNAMEQNILLENLGSLSIFDNSYNLLYNGVSKLYNIINNMI